MNFKKVIKELNPLEKEIVYFMVNSIKSISINKILSNSKITKHSRRIGIVILSLEEKGIIHLDKNDKSINCECTYYLNNHIKNQIIGE